MFGNKKKKMEEKRLRKIEALEHPKGYDPGKTVYRGFFRQTDYPPFVEPVVTVFDGDCYQLPMSTFAKTKSQEFAWGYNGSGPTALAHSILTHFFFGEENSLGEADEVYQEFKQHFVSHWEQGKEWKITGNEIYEWFKTVMSESKD